MMTQLKLTPEQSGFFFVKRLLVLFSLTTWNSFSKQKSCLCHKEEDHQPLTVWKNKDFSVSHILREIIYEN